MTRPSSQPMNRSELYRWVMALGFCAYDLLLYLTPIRMTHRHSLITISATNYTIQLKRHTRNVSNRCPHLAASRWRTGTGMTVQCHGKE